MRRERTAKLPPNGDPYPVEETANRNLMKVNDSVLSPARGKAVHAEIQAANIQDCVEKSTVSGWREISILFCSEIH